MFRGFVTFRWLHLIHAAHAVGFHRGDGLAEQDKIEAGEGLDGWMVGDVAVYLLSGLGAQGIVVAGHEAILIHKGDVPEGHVADDVMLHGCSLVIVDAGDAGRMQDKRGWRAFSQMPTTAQERFMYLKLFCIVVML